jgi:hypothetical protein
MRGCKWIIILLLIIFTACVTGVRTAGAGAVPRMTKEELKGMLGSSDLMIIDVRRGNDWTSSEFKIKGALRKDPSAFDKWKGDLPKDKTVVLYCA